MLTLIRAWPLRAAMALAIAALAAGLTAGGAAAASVSASPSTVGPSGTVFLSGNGFVPNDTVTVRIVGPTGETSTLTFPADGAGQFGGPISPSQGSASPGLYTVTATGTRTAFSATTTFTVAAAGAVSPAAVGSDPAAVVSAFDAALNAGDLEGALALFADDAVIVPPSGPRVTGRGPIRAYLQALLAQHVQFTVVGERRVTGDTERHTARIALDDWRRLGIPALEATAEVVVRGGLLRSFTTALTPDSIRRLQAALTGAAPAPAPPSALPRTGGGALGFVEPVLEE